MMPPDTLPRRDTPADGQTRDPRRDDRSGAPIVRSLVGRLKDLGRRTDPTVADIVDSLGATSFGPLMLVPALIIVTPLSGIPFLSSIGGLCIALVALQMIVGRDHAWFPGWLMRRRLSGRRLASTLERMERPLDLFGRVTRPRLDPLVRRPFVLAPQLLCLLCGLAMPFLELVPFTSSASAAAVAVFAMALIVRDGLLVVVGLVLAGGLAGFGLAALFG